MTLRIFLISTVVLLATGCSQKETCLPTVVRCTTPTVEKPVLLNDVNTSNPTLLLNLIGNYSKMLEYADKLEKANKVCQ